jgi:hypothetical protein
LSDVDGKELSLSPWAVIMAIPPLLVVGGAAIFVSNFGYMTNYVAMPVDFNGHAEAAARLSVLATFLLLTGVAVAVLVLTAVDLRFFEAGSRTFLLLLLASFALGGVVAVRNGVPEEAQRFVSQPMVCYSLKHIEDPGHPKRLAEKAEAPARRYLPDQPVPFKRWDARCDAKAYKLLVLLSDIQRILLSLVTPALVFGSIASLAVPGSAGARLKDMFAKRSSKVRSLQAARLTNYLYLSAALLVTGLLFLSALLRWPGYSLHPADLKIYNAQVDALVLYWGIAYSLFIASYYLPSALILGQAAEAEAEAEPEPDPGKKKATAKADTVSLLSPFELLKVSASIFAPAIAGLLSGAIRL